MKLIEKIKMILTKPTEFFKKTEKNYTIKESFTYMAILSLFGVIMGAIVSYFFQSTYTGIFSSIFGLSLPSANLTFMLLAFIVVFGYIVTLVSSFITAGFLHIWILIFGGKGNYTKTYHLYNHARTPSLLFSWIPIIGALMPFYTIFILIFSTPISHKISKRRSAIMYLIPVVIFFVLIGYAFYIGMSVLQANPDLIQNISTINY